jgi:hypothetical protein
MHARGARFGLAAVAVGASLLGRACGGSEASGPKAPVQEAAAVVSMHDAGTDMSRCDPQQRSDREVSETAGPAAVAPNVRSVYRVVGEGETARRVLICREVDTNLDGVKDVVWVYSDRGEALGEQADANYDGRIDTWIKYANGRVLQLEIDTDRDGRPDETHHYVDGKVSRVERDTNANGRTDVWEIYVEGRLRRMGVDLDHDGHVDRWDRDQVAVRLEEEREREEEERAAHPQAEREPTVADGGAPDAGPAASGR